MIAELARPAVAIRPDLGLDFALRAVDVAPEESSAVRQTRTYSQISGLPFWCVACEADGPRVVVDASNTLHTIPQSLLERFREAKEPCFEVVSSGIAYYSLPLPSANDTPMIALGCVRLRPDRRPDELVMAAVEAGWTKRQLDEWLRDQPYASPNMVRQLLNLTWAQVSAEAQEQQLRQELFAVAEQIDETYEEITLLHSLTGNLHLSRTPEDLAEFCLARVRELTQAEGAAIVFSDHSGNARFLTSGQLPFDQAGLERLCARCEKRDWSKPFVKNQVSETPLKHELPDLRNFVLCAIGEKSARSGWLIHCNSPRSFGSVQASLLQSIAKILGTHLHNRELFEQNEDLLTSFVRSMVSTIDAKDSYTRGHSERVALVAQCLAEEIGLSAEEADDIYLSGLLHDIGKVGVDDRILRKDGRLNDEEFEQIMKHPLIGCQILSGLQNLQHVLPGVRNHHEAYNGTGYPDRLKGDEIPLMARVIAVADSYDAMGSDRPYRKGMSLDRMEMIFRENAGPQWDPILIEAYFRARTKIRKVWSAHRPNDLSALASGSGIGRQRFFNAGV